MLGAAIALAAVAALLLAGVAIQEYSYANAHPYRYGPAKVIATAGAAGALLAVSVVIIGVHLSRSASRDSVKR